MAAEVLMARYAYKYLLCTSSLGFGSLARKLCRHWWYLIYDLYNSNNTLLEFKCNFIWFWSNCDLYFSFLFSCYFSRNQNGKGSSYGLLFSHVETILVMFSKESLTGSGIICSICSCWLEILCKVWKNSGDISSSPISLGATVVAAMIICLFLLVSQICCFDIRRILFHFPLKLANLDFTSLHSL